ncbi:MAG TPA: TadE/TadG family type IV pilus assembly protein [Parasulfuritortus sp.]
MLDINQAKGRRQHGVAIIELALVLVFLLLLTVGISEIGRAFWYYSALQKAAREGARCLSVDKWEDTQTARDAADACLSVVTSDASSAWVTSDAGGGRPMTVKMTLDGTEYSNTSQWGVSKTAPQYVGILVQYQWPSWWQIGAVAAHNPLHTQIYAAMPLMNY